MGSLLKTIFRSDLKNIFTKFKIPLNCYKLSRSFASSSKEIKLNFHEECESQINQQINQELFASYAYLTMAYHFEHPTVSLLGFFSMFLFFSREETQHAEKMIEFQNKRGGKVKYSKIGVLEGCDWTPESAVLTAIELEKSVTQMLHTLHEKGSTHKDCHLCDFVESVYLQEQYSAIKELYHLLAKIRRLDEGVGIHILDNQLRKQFKDKKIE